MYETKPTKPSADALSWLFGIGAPVLLLCYSANCFLTHTAVISGKNGSFNLTGLAATGYAVFVLFLAAYVHFRFWWNTRPDSESDTVADWGMALSLVGMVPSGLYVAWSIISLYWQ
jgi:hypothetical protein